MGIKIGETPPKFFTGYRPQFYFRAKEKKQSGFKNILNSVLGRGEEDHGKTKHLRGEPRD